MTAQSLIGKYALFLAALLLFCAAATLLLNGGRASFEYPRIFGAILNEPGADIYLGELPRAADGALADGEIEWRKAAEVIGTAEADAHDGAYWLRFGLPDEPFDAPVLRVRQLAQYEVYVNGDLALSYNMHRPTFRLDTSKQVRLVSLPPDRASTVVHLRVVNHAPGIALGRVTIADGKTEYGDLLRRNAPRALLAVALLVMAAASLLGFLMNVRRPVYAYFAALALVSGASGLVHTSLAHFFIDLSAVSYYMRLAFPVGLLAFVAFLEQLYGPGAYAVHRRMQYALGGYTVVCAIAAWANGPAYIQLTGSVTMWLAFACGVVTAYSLTRFASPSDGKLGWIFIGYCVLALFGAAQWALAVFPSVHPMLHDQAPLFNYYWKESTLYVGIFSFVACIGLAFASHLRDLHQWVEDLVAQRTAELEAKHRQLQASTRETFEALREVSVWEERNRIAQEIHNILGHQLTGAAMQLEAAKRLIRLDPDAAAQRIDISLESVRRGLGDVRSAVRMMKMDVGGQDAAGLLTELIDATIELTGVDVDAEFGSLPPLDALQKKVLYYALQEGLTNGIKHGGARRFVLELGAEGGAVRFALRNDGKPYAPVPRGFGLSTLHDRVAELGGTLAIGDDGGRGAALEIRFPAPCDLPQSGSRLG